MAAAEPYSKQDNQKQSEQRRWTNKVLQMKHIPTREIVLLFIATRIVLIVITYFGDILLTATQYSTAPVNLVALFTAWSHWDALRYLHIAQYGYQKNADFAFFPLFPLLIACLSYVLGSWSYLFVGTLLSNGALLVALFLLYQLAQEITGDKIARRAVLYLSIFPTAFFFFAAYNESLFLVFLLGAFLAMRRQRWWIAGSLGFFAALTRSAGILLVLPLLYELWQVRERTYTTLLSQLCRLFSVALIPTGTLVYCVYCWITVRNPLAFITAQDSYGRHLEWPWQGLWQGITTLLFAQPFGSANQAHLLLDVGATLGFLLLTVLGWRKLPVSYSLWVAMLFLYILLDPAMDKPDILLSNQRFVLEMFPAFITLAFLGIQHPRLHQALIIIFPTLLATLSILFIMNRWLV